MERCRGKTKAGKRCKRAPGEGSDFCSAHRAQGHEPAAEARGRSETGPRTRPREEYDSVDRIWGLVTMGLILGAVLALRGSWRIL